MAIGVYEVPLTPAPQKFAIALGGNTYNLTLTWNNAPMGGWKMDIAAADDTPIAQGLPLVTGADLLEQYEYLGIPGGIVVVTDGEVDDVPAFENLGIQSHLYYLTGQGT